MSLERMAEDAALLRLGTAWVEQTQGGVVPGVMWDAVRYASELKRLPLFGRVRGRLDEVVSLVGKRLNIVTLVRPDLSKGIAFLQYFPTVRNVIEHFLREPDYCNDKQNECGSPKKLGTVLRDYVCGMDDGEGGFENGKGDAHRVGHAFQRKRFTEQELLRAVGLKERWETYQKTRGVPKDYKREAKRVIEHFLREPDYCVGDTYNRFGSPKKLGSVLRDYVCGMDDGEGGFEHRKGDARRVDQAFQRKRFTEQELLTSIGLLEAWNDYQKTTAERPFVYRPQKYEKKGAQ